MGCRKFQAWLPLMADCLLSETQQLKLEKHLKECPQCQKEATLYKTIVEHCCQLPEVELPCDFYDRLSRKLKLECSKPTFETKSWTWRMPLMVGSLSAAALLALLITLPEKNPTVPTNFIASFPTKSQAVKLAPLLNPTAPNTGISSNTKVQSQLSPKTAEKKESINEKTDSFSDNQATFPSTSPSLAQAPGKSSISEPQPPLIHKATFAPAVQSIPAYSVPHTPPFSQSDNDFITNAIVSKRLQADIPLRSKPDCMIVRNAGQLQQALEYSKQSAPLFTDLDWKKQMLAAIFLDPVVCTGYQIQLDAIEQMPDKICIRYKIQRPTSVVPTNSSSPSLFLVLPYSELPVEFSEL